MTQKKLKQPIILAIETSTPKLSLALYKNNKIFETILEKDLPDYAENLIPQLDKLLKQSKTTLKDISLIGCNIGPGSFTGLRVGLCFARTLAEELKIKLFISNSFYMCLTNFLPYKSLANFNEKFSVIVLLSAVKSEVYYKKFLLNKNSITESSKELCIKKSEVIPKIEKTENTFIIGNEVDFLLTENIINKKNIIKIFPQARDLIKIFLETKFYTRISTKKVSPLYIRHTYY